MMEIIDNPYAQSMFENGNNACTAISTVFAIFVDVDEWHGKRLPWEMLSNAGAAAWRMWYDSQSPGKQVGQFCEAYELLQSVPSFRQVAAYTFDYRVHTGYLFSDMTEAVAANMETDEKAQSCAFSEMIDLSEALTKHVRSGYGAVLTHEAITIGLTRSRESPETFYVFDSHTACVDSDGVRRARFMRFLSVANLLDWYLSDVCNAERLNLTRPHGAEVHTASVSQLQACMFSLTVFYPVEGSSAAAAAARPDSEATSTEHDVRPLPDPVSASGSGSRVIVSGPRVLKTGGAAGVASSPGHAPNSRRLGNAGYSPGGGGYGGSRYTPTPVSSARAAAAAGSSSCAAYRQLWR